MKVIAQLSFAAALLGMCGVSAGTTKPPTPAPTSTKKPTSAPSTAKPTPFPTSSLRSAVTFHLPGDSNSVVKPGNIFYDVGVCNDVGNTAYVCKKYDATGTCVKKTMIPNEALYVSNLNSNPKAVRLHQRTIQPANFQWWYDNICVGGLGIHIDVDCTNLAGITPYDFKGPVQCADGV